MSGVTELARAVDVMMKRAKRIYILIIKVNKLFSFFSPRCFLKEIENMFSVFLSSFNINLPAFYHECCPQIGYTTHVLFKHRVFLWRNHRLIVAPRKFYVLKTNICPTSEASRANMLVLRTSNFQGATIRGIVPRQKHSIVFIVHHQIFFRAS